MHMIIAPVTTDLATAIQPYRNKYDAMAEVIPPHITIVRPFPLSDPLPKLFAHLKEAGEIHAPIKASVAGWDIHTWEVGKQANYQFRLPIMAGRQELTSLRTTLLTDLLSNLAKQDTAYWPHIIFGRFSTKSKLEAAKESLKGFGPRFTFRITHIELLYQEQPITPWKVQKQFGLNATLAGSRKKRERTKELM